MARYLITLNSGVHADQTAAQAAIESVGATLIKSYVFSLTYEVEATAEQIANLAGVVEAVEKNSPTLVTVQNANQNHLSYLISSSNSFSTSYTPRNTGTNGHIYLVDTGLYGEHEQFVDTDINYLYSNFGSDFSDNVGHGTAVASVIVGNTNGVSKDATLHIVKLFDTSSGSVTIGEILDALDAVLVHHNANDPSKVKVVCLPWVTAQNNFLDNKITEMNASNLIVVAAAGNDGVDVNTVSPGGVDSVLTVGACDANFNVTSFTNVPWTNPASTHYNNFGAALDIFTLGVDVSCADITASDAYVSITGTSISTGIAAGVAVQWANSYSSKTASELKDIIVQEGHLIGSRFLAFEENLPMAGDNIYRSLVTVELVGDNVLGNLPSGRILNIQRGQSIVKDLELNLENGENFRLLDFAPLPTWASIDFTTGMLSVNTEGMDPSLVPGIYLFGIAATVSGKTVVEEYSIGVYNSAVTELEEAIQYYYDAENNSYDEVIAFQSSAMQQK